MNASLLMLVLMLAPGPVLAQSAPDLGQAGSFAVLGGSAVTNTGATLIVGELGVSPNTAVTGFPPGVVTGGSIHINDAVAQQAQSDLTTAYNQLAGQAANADLSGQDLGGLTLTSGVYRFSSSAQLTGTLTLNAQGNPDAIFIFQIGTTLTTASGARVQVINGGSNCNIYWQVGSSATLGTATVFAGNILALASITLNTGAQVSGRMLARNGAVTLDGNNVSVCPLACQPIMLSPATLPAAINGSAYNQIISAAGGTAPYTFAVSSGALPPGLTLLPNGPSSALLAGVPNLSGSYTFSITATDALGCPGTRSYTLVVNIAGCPVITLNPLKLPQALVGTPYSQLLTAAGGTAPYSFAVTAGALPQGMLLSSSGPSTALLAGTLASAGSFEFTITATDAAGCLVAQNYNLQANGPVCPTINLAPTVLPALVVGSPFTQQLSASGGTSPYAFIVSAGVLPPGIVLQSSGPATAQLAGTPLLAGNYNFSIRVTDAAGCMTTQNYNLLVNAPACPSINLTPASLPGLVVGSPYSQLLSASGGTNPFTFAVVAGGLPGGLTLQAAGPASALLSGTPLTLGNFDFTVRATDAAGCFIERRYLLRATPAAIALPMAAGSSLLLGLLLMLVAVRFLRR